MTEKGETVFDARKNIIVNYVPSSYSEKEFQDIFAKIGQISSCILMRNKENGKSLNYGFVCFEDEKCAAQAIEEINGIVLEGKTLKVKYAKEPDSEEKNTNIYVAGLPDWVSDDQLLSLFNQFGEVVSHIVLTNKDGASKKAGMVRFAKNTDATVAIEQMNQRTLPEASTPITVKFALPPTSKRELYDNVGLLGYAQMRNNQISVPLTRTPKSAVAQALAELGIQNLDTQSLDASIYVFGLSDKATELTLFELFSAFGGVLSVKLMRDNEKDGNPCKGFGFVNYVSQLDALRAVKAMNGVTYEDRKLQVSMKIKNK